MLKQNRFKYTGASLLFLAVTVIHLLASMFTSLISEKYTIPIGLELVLSELTILIPSIIWLLIVNAPLAEELGFKKIKISTVLMSLLLMELLTPLITLINIFSQLFEGNEVLLLVQSFGDENRLVLIILIGLYGPLCEELAFRGIISRRMMKYGSPLMASLVSGFFFGLLHFNFNQFCYAFALGMIFAIINYATGSIWPSIIMHTLVNSKNAVMMVLTTKLYSKMDIDIYEAVDSVYDGDMMYYMIGIYLVLAIICTLASLPVFDYMARNEGRPDAYRRLLQKPANEEAVMAGRSWWLNGFSIIACTICVIIIFFLDAILKMAG